MKEYAIQPDLCFTIYVTAVVTQISENCYERVCYKACDLSFIMYVTAVVTQKK